MFLKEFLKLFYALILENFFDSGNSRRIHRIDIEKLDKHFFGTPLVSLVHSTCSQAVDQKV